MTTMCRSLLVICLVLGSACAQFTLPPLQYAYNAIEPFIDQETMILHHTRHHNASVGNLNRNLALCHKDDCASRTLVSLLMNANGFSHTPADVGLAIRNNGGSHFNHAMYWRTLCGNKNKKKCQMPTRLSRRFRTSFGDVAKMRADFEATAARLFGSGWTWVVLDTTTGKLKIVNTPNQDNPLMPGALIGEANKGIPILGVDLWEHAYYLKHRNVRAEYVKLWWDVVNWPQVLRNFNHAKNGSPERLEMIWRD